MKVDPKFKKDDIVFHVSGGKGKVLDTQNDWSTDPPTKMVTVQVLNTIFHSIRRIPQDDLIIERR